MIECQFQGGSQEHRFYGYVLLRGNPEANLGANNSLLVGYTDPILCT
jgi:hypothetical protein